MLMFRFGHWCFVIGFSRCSLCLCGEYSSFPLVAERTTPQVKCVTANSFSMLSLFCGRTGRERSILVVVRSVPVCRFVARVCRTGSDSQVGHAADRGGYDRWR